MQQSTGELLLPAALEAHMAPKRRLFQVVLLPHIVAAPVTPLRISGLTVLGGGCALFHAFLLPNRNLVCMSCFCF